MTEGETVLAAALGVSIVTGLFTLGGVQVSQRLARQAAIASERRQTRVDERRQAVAPIRVFLDKAARASGRQFAEEAATAAYDPNLGGIQQIVPRESFFAVVDPEVKDPPSVGEPTRESVVAMASAPTTLLSFWISVVTKLAIRKGETATRDLRHVIDATRREVEDHVVGGLEDK